MKNKLSVTILLGCLAVLTPGVQAAEGTVWDHWRTMDFAKLSPSRLNQYLFDVMKSRSEDAVKKQVVEALLEEGADVNATEGHMGEKSTVLHAAVAYDLPDIVQLLLKKGADINAPGGRRKQTALMQASYLPEITKILVDSGAALDIQDEQGMTALMHAVTSGSPQVVERLVFAGADLNQKDKQGMTALDYAQDPEKKGIIEEVRKSMQEAIIEAYAEREPGEKDDAQEKAKVPGYKTLPPEVAGIVSDTLLGEQK